MVQFEMRVPLNNTLVMKTIRILLGLLAVSSFLVDTAQAEPGYRYAQYRVPRRTAPPAPGQTHQTNQTHRVKPAEPADKPVKFKELPINSEFYFLADKERKLFPRIKISETSARTIPTPGNPNVTTSPVPAETQVIAKKAGASGKDEKKGQDDKKKKS